MYNQTQPIPQPSPSVAEPSVLFPKRNNLGRIILIILVILILIISLSANFLQYQEISIFGIGTKPSRLPINPKNPYVEDYSISYYLKAQIKDIKKTPQGLELSTNIRDTQAPEKYYIDSKTSVLVSPDGNKNNSKPSDPNQLKVGQNIQLWMYQNNETKNWTTFKIVFTPMN